MTENIAEPDGCGCESVGCIACDPDHNQATYLKYVGDGATTLGEVAAKLEQFAASLRADEAAGWQLEDEVSDGHVFMVKPQEVSAS